MSLRATEELLASQDGRNSILLDSVCYLHNECAQYCISKFTVTGIILRPHSCKNIQPFSRRLYGTDLHIEVAYIMFPATPYVCFIELLVDSPMASFYAEGDETSG